MSFEEAIEVLDALRREGVQLVVIGSMAMAAQGLPRAAHDLAVFVAPDRRNIEALKRALRALFDDASIDEIDPAEMAGPYPAVAYTPPHGRYSLDFLTRLGEELTWQQILDGSELLDVGAGELRVATPELLFRMKRDTVRPQDRVDAERIREAFDLGEAP